MAIKQIVNIDTSNYLGTDFNMGSRSNPLNSILPKIEVLKVITRKVSNQNIDSAPPKGEPRPPLYEYETTVHASITETKQPQMDGYNWLNIPEYTNLFKISCLQVLQTEARPGIIRFQGVSDRQEFEFSPGIPNRVKIEAALQPIDSIVPFRAFERAASYFLSSGRVANMILNGVEYSDMKSEILYELRRLHFEAYRDFTYYRNQQSFTEIQERIENDLPPDLAFRAPLIEKCTNKVVRGCPEREFCFDPDGHAMNCSGERSLTNDFPRNSIAYRTFSSPMHHGFVSTIDAESDARVEIQQLSLDHIKAHSEQNSYETGYSNTYSGMIRRVESETSFKVPIKFKFRYQARGINFLSHHLFIDFDFFQMMDMFDSNIAESWHTLAEDQSAWPVLSNQSTRIVSATNGRKLDFVDKYYSSGELYRGSIYTNNEGVVVGQDDSGNEITLSKRRFPNSKVDFESGPLDSYYSFMVYGGTFRGGGETRDENGELLSWRSPHEHEPWREKQFSLVETEMPPPRNEFDRVLDQETLALDKRRNIVDNDREVDYRDYESERSRASRRNTRNSLVRAPEFTNDYGSFTIAITNNPGSSTGGSY